MKENPGEPRETGRRHQRLDVALIANSATRTLLFSIDESLVAPKGLKRELEQYGGLLREKSGLNETELDVLTSRCFDLIEIVPVSELEGYREEATEALADVDPDDVIYLATALAVDGIIWSDDRDFQEQDLVPVVTTEDVMSEFGSEE